MLEAAGHAGGIEHNLVECPGSLANQNEVPIVVLQSRRMVVLGRHRIEIGQAVSIEIANPGHAEFVRNLRVSCSKSHCIEGEVPLREPGLVVKISMAPRVGVHLDEVEVGETVAIEVAGSG